jgi:TetR/AcrR family transcriptional regulator
VVNDAAAAGTVQVHDVEAQDAGGLKLPGHRQWVFVVDFLLGVVPLGETDAFSVDQINGGNDVHSLPRRFGGRSAKIRVTELNQKSNHSVNGRVSVESTPVLDQTTDKITTEERILAAAKTVFTQKGYAGTRMQEVADTAGINKAMLHYYFRSKEKLFRVILSEALNVLAPVVLRVLKSDKDVLGKLEDMVNNYLQILLDRPHLPLFVMHELSQNQGSFVKEMMKSQNTQPYVMAFFQQVIEEGERGKIRKVDPIHLMMNTMSMIVFPFISWPMITTATGMPEEMFQPILEQRKAQIMDFLRAALAV